VTKALAIVNHLAGIWPPEIIDIIAAVEQFQRSYVVLPSSAYLPLALWTVATSLADIFDCFPYLALLSPAKRCGKTRLLEVLESLCVRAWRGTAPTPAALYRMMQECPTLLLDEVEGLRGKQVSEMAQAVLSILNAGHRRGATVPRCDGKDHKLIFFPVYGPKAFAAIGKLPDTLADRSIIITMQRRMVGQKVSRFLFGRAKAEASPIVQAIDKWANEHLEDVRAFYQSSGDLPFLSDRDADLWLPLFAVCGIAAPARMSELKKCASELTAAKAAGDLEDSLPLHLLTDVRDVWPKGAAHVATAELLSKLRDIAESPWVEVDLTARKLARMLRPFGVERRQVRIGSLTVKGYTYTDLEVAASRYLPTVAVERETQETGRVNTGENELFQRETTS
jgi:hypothetical protein